MTIKVGDKLPEGSLVEMTADGPAAHTIDDLFGGKKVVLFALPGAFTPTCSAKHLPGFIEKSTEIKAKGVDAIYCMSVNDAFVMGAWAKDQNAGDAVTLLADGNCDFTKAIDLVLDGTGFGMGLRSKRFSMIVEDGTVTVLNVEDGGDFSVSTAEHALSQL